MDYSPTPVDTSGVELPSELGGLIESLARNTHEVWAARRMAEGWRVGPRRDDDLKLHPGLVPYEDLPESEKEYDRSTASEVVRLIFALGYVLQPTNV